MKKRTSSKDRKRYRLNELVDKINTEVQKLTLLPNQVAQFELSVGLESVVDKNDNNSFNLFTVESGSPSPCHVLKIVVGTNSSK